MFRGTYIVVNSFVTSLCARNCILTINLLAISKTAVLEFIFIFLDSIRVVGGVPRCFESSQFFCS